LHIFNGHKENDTIIPFIPFKTRINWWCLTIFALAKMTTFSFESGYSILKMPLLSTNFVATFLFESGYFVKITLFNVLPLLFKSIIEL